MGIGQCPLEFEDPKHKFINMQSKLANGDEFICLMKWNVLRIEMQFRDYLTRFCRDFIDIGAKENFFKIAILQSHDINSQFLATRQDSRNF